MIYNASADRNIDRHNPMTAPKTTAPKTTTSKTPHVISSGRLTTCGVVDKGRAIHLGFLDRAGEAITVELPFDQTLSLIMTLPHLIGRAITQQTNDPTARCVFSLKHWTLERVDEDGLIVTLGTDDGFAVSFNVPLDTCRELGMALRQESKPADERRGENSLRPSSPPTLN